ncbi:PREDICTED: uncharacterized protein LOC106818472 [Priapulus caudatus]|uniref:Uncharacterized protein LOC106818472 n=1 Tax=Priapulus caudatus TaxID=37621 RepID=A0ABM1F2J0_PRICU|nr:PREDICTED: uncharacterized protein LOC106818472 [Priapulus caudatus]
MRRVRCLPPTDRLRDLRLLQGTALPGGRTRNRRGAILSCATLTVTALPIAWPVRLQSSGGTGLLVLHRHIMTFLLAFKDQLGINRWMHYRVFYALYLHENTMTEHTRSDIASTLHGSNKGQQCISRYGSVQQNGSKIFPKNVDCRTGHSLAYGPAGRRYIYAAGLFI